MQNPQVSEAVLFELAHKFNTTGVSFINEVLTYVNSHIVTSTVNEGIVKWNKLGGKNGTGLFLGQFLDLYVFISTQLASTLTTAQFDYLVTHTDVGGAVKNYLNSLPAAGFSASQIAEIKTVTKNLIAAVMVGELSTPSKIISLLNLVKDIHQKKSSGTPRVELVSQIEKIRQFLASRHTDYGEMSQYLGNVLPFLIFQNEFTYAEVYKIYELAHATYLEAVYRSITLPIRAVIEMVKPFIEISLFDIGLSFTAQASYRLLALLPQSVKNATALVWNKITAIGANRPNTLIPDVFELSLSNGNKIYVQADGTKHLAEIVTKNNATNFGWFQAHKGLRSQIVLDDFAKAVDDIIAKNPGINYNQLYYSGNWEIKFGAPNTGGINSNGLTRIYHALSTP